MLSCLQKARKISYSIQTHEWLGRNDGRGLSVLLGRTGGALATLLLLATVTQVPGCVVAISYRHGIFSVLPSTESVGNKGTLNVGESSRGSASAESPSRPTRISEMSEIHPTIQWPFESG